MASEIAKNYMDINIIGNNKNNKFLFYANKLNLHQLKGHSSIGGMRANIYNSINISGVKKLIYFMEFFKKKYQFLY